MKRQGSQTIRDWTDSSSCLLNPIENTHKFKVQRGAVRGSNAMPTSDLAWLCSPGLSIVRRPAQTIHTGVLCSSMTVSVAGTLSSSLLQTLSGFVAADLCCSSSPRYSAEVETCTCFKLQLAGCTHLTPKVACSASRPLLKHTYRPAGKQFETVRAGRWRSARTSRQREHLQHNCY